MNRNIALMGAALVLAGCASNDVANQDTLNDRSDRLAALEDRQPPNPNRPPDNRDQKAAPNVIQHDPALDKAETTRDDKGLAINAGPDQHVRPQDPTQSDDAPKAVGGPAAQAQSDTVTSADSALAARVKDAFLKTNDTDSNTDPELTSRETNGEKKVGPNLEVTAKNGVVTLSGSVASETERTSREQVASRVPGVVSVNNYLVVNKPAKQ